MSLKSCSRINHVAGVLVVALAFLPAFLLAGPSQPGRRGGGDSRGPAQPPNTGGPSVANELDGTLRGYIMNFAPSKDDADETLLGYLKFKPLEKKSKIIKLAVHKDEELKIGIPNFPLNPEEATENLTKGLFCTATWQPNRDPKNKSVKRELKELTLDTLEIEGKIEEIADDFITIKGRPKDGDWPVVEGDGPAKPAGNAPKLAAQKKIKLKVMADVTKYSDPNDTPLEAADFQVDQSVDATIVYGKSQGIIVSLRTPGPRTAKAIAPQPSRGGTPPPPRGGGRRPVGGG